MTTNRMEAFSDGVLAIVITIMVLEFKVPHEPTFEALRPLLPVVLSYILSFIYLAIYWNNHHHLMQVTEHVNGKVLWANMHLLLWLSVIPFATAWMGEAFGQVPVTIYSCILLMAAIAFTILERSIIRLHGPDSLLARATAGSWKEFTSLALYLVALCASFLNPWISIDCFIVVAIIWLMPDGRIERLMLEEYQRSQEETKA
ncbi:MAG: DUF1211 domain-containing protein [Fimbriimonadaceae bacterium]|nr:DUF1211 domain-containing protein [Fimbriimonadaceae bacterium]